VRKRAQNGNGMSKKVHTMTTRIIHENDSFSQFGDNEELLGDKGNLKDKTMMNGEADSRLNECNTEANNPWGQVEYAASCRTINTRAHTWNKVSASAPKTNGSIDTCSIFSTLLSLAVTPNKTRNSNKKKCRGSTAPNAWETCKHQSS